MSLTSNAVCANSIHFIFQDGQIGPGFADWHSVMDIVGEDNDPISSYFQM